MSAARPRLAISTGDSGGIGPEIAVHAAGRFCQQADCVLFGQRAQLEPALRALGLEVVALIGDGASRERFVPGKRRVGLCDVATSDEAQSIVHRPTAEGGRAQLAALDAAVASVESGQCDALVTAPMSKEAVNLAGVAFVGHTGYLAGKAGLASDAVTMIFAGPRLCVSLVTTHVPICLLSEQITTSSVERAGRHLVEFLRQRDRRSAQRRVAVCGLNPHAGEGGVLGDEETLVIAPAVASLTRDITDVEWLGPLGAETAFRWASDGGVDAVVAQFHDQATVASKLLDWGRAVNVTWGLPYVRVSVDHGVAYDAAASGAVDSSAMCAAVELALQLI